MRLQPLELGKLFNRTGRHLAGCGGYRQRHQHFVRMKTRVMIAQVLAFQLLHRLDDLRLQQGDFIVNAAQRLERIQQHSGGWAQQ